jgi:carboxylesterase
VKLLGPLLGYTEVVNTPQEDKVYYHFRPQESLQQLQLLALDVRKALQKGISLPEGCSLKIYKSTHDETADPVSAVLMYKGLSKSDGTPVEVEMVESNLHVFTRLALRSQVSATDASNQLKCFTEMADKLVK